uniref:Homeobox protein C6 n=1 Tax=Strongyloides venezuelensis TaxID=75913 RepID=A0A0K0F2V3_STRVS
MTLMNSFYVGASPAYQALGLHNGFAGYPTSDSRMASRGSQLSGGPPQHFPSAASRHLASEPQMATAISSQFVESFYAGAQPQHNHFGYDGFAGYKY